MVIIRRRRLFGGTDKVEGCFGKFKTPAVFSDAVIRENGETRRGIRVGFRRNGGTPGRANGTETEEIDFRREVFGDEVYEFSGELRPFCH